MGLDALKKWLGFGDRGPSQAERNCAHMAAEHQAGRVPDYERVLALGYPCFLGPGAVVADVGAHEGLHLARFIELAGPTGAVIGFEPLPTCFATLTARFAQPNVTLHNAALSNVAGVAEFIFARGTPQESGLRERVFNNPGMADPVRIEVATLRLDDVLKDATRLDFIKIDAEGAELLILEGAAATLRRLRPVVSVEYGRPSYSAYGNSAETLFDFATRHDYVICDLFGAPIPSRSLWLTICDRSFWDWYLVPREKLAGWTRQMAPMAEVDEVLRRLG